MQFTKVVALSNWFLKDLMKFSDLDMRSFEYQDIDLKDSKIFQLKINDGIKIAFNPNYLKAIFGEVPRLIVLQRIYVILT